MSRFANIPTWVIAIFSFFCLLQVSIRMEQMVESFEEGQSSFNFQGHRFYILPNRSFIVDESLAQYGIDTRCKDKLN